MEGTNFNNVSEMIQGCNEAMVNYVLTDDMKFERIVTFYNSDVFDLDIIAGHQNLLWQKQGNVSISKLFLYRILTFAKVIKRGFDFHTTLFKNVKRYTPSPENTQYYSKH